MLQQVVAQPAFLVLAVPVVRLALLAHRPPLALLARLELRSQGLKVVAVAVALFRRTRQAKTAARAVRVAVAAVVVV